MTKSDGGDDVIRRTCEDSSVIEPSSARAAVRALTRVARLLDRTLPELSLADFRVLSAIAEGEGRASRLAQRLALGKPAVSSTVDSLVRRGLLVRTSGAADQRVVELVLTDEGERVRAAAEAELEALVRDVVSRTADPEAVLAALAAFGDAIEQRQSDLSTRASDPSASIAPVSVEAAR